MATTDKQKDHFAQYNNPEVISGNGTLGRCRVIAQLKNGKWAIWDATGVWGGQLFKGLRMRDHSGRLVTFESKEQVIEFSKKMK